jgi:hypothetical protein
LFLYKVYSHCSFFANNDTSGNSIDCGYVSVWGFLG